ncbi:F-box protein SKIP27-like [Chenopodium quinoa]|uniref:F-box domain-containing protein n=1 Tax=Chenopodium quinoa TaxID=63459 RepID=A0A803LPL9_CHEQI|nr:F-box protein SKIP27-like [Chenopodium quinoa]
MALTKSLSFSLGRKRILISNDSCDLEQFCADFEQYSPITKRQCYFTSSGDEDDETFRLKNANSNSLLEALPQEILIKIVCGVNHDDLKQLFLVSKTIRDAAIIAKKSHFEFTTPLKTKAFRNSIDLVNSPLDLEEIEAPNAPKQARKMNRPRISKKRLSDISVALFSDKGEDEQRWSRRSLFMETDT